MKKKGGVGDKWKRWGVWETCTLFFCDHLFETLNLFLWLVCFWGPLRNLQMLQFSLKWPCWHLAKRFCVRSCPRPFALHQLSRKVLLQLRLRQCMCHLFHFHVCAAVAFCHSFFDFSLQLPIYFDLKVGMSCNNMDAFESHLAFSRRAVWGSIFNPIYVVRPPISIPGSVQTAVEGMDGNKRSHLLHLCGQLLRLVLIPCHAEEEPYQWTRTTAISFAAELDGHVLGTLWLDGM